MESKLPTPISTLTTRRTQRVHDAGECLAAIRRTRCFDRCRPTSTPDEAALKQRYDEQKARFTTQEQRLASHILVKVEKNANPDAQKAALEKAKAIAAEAKSGKDFAALAKEKSDDLGSKAQGGDLGWLEKGVTDPAFETACSR